MKHPTILLYLSLVVLFQCSSPDSEKAATKPEANRFEIELVAENLNQPMSMDILKDGRILFVEKEGAVKVFDPSSSFVSTIAEIPVNKRFNQPYTTSGQKYDADDGMHGVVVDPDFEQNGFVYFYYSPESEDPKSLLVRYTWKGSFLDMDSKKILLEWRTQREICCHWGGGMIFDGDGNLLLAVGDNSGFNINNKNGDSRRTSGNTNDLRGSILRIKPEPDGTYTIPEGNLFPEGTPDTRPEIYIMGVRNPWRLSMDSKTGWLYWGEVGPSTDEFNFAREAGNFGWPFFIADNQKHLKIETDYDTLHIINDSPHNTGLPTLPPHPVPALAWYDRNPSEIFPGSGSLSAVGGPFFRSADFRTAERPFPAYYDGKWFVTDYVRGWIMVMEVDDDGHFKSIEEFMPGGTFTGINDMDFAPNGDLYVLQYGHDSYASYAKDAKLFRIKYNDGNRKPIAMASSDKAAGAVPMEVKLMTMGTIDYDENIVEYTWTVAAEGEEPIVFKEQNPVVNIDNPGIYQAILTVKDAEGATDQDTVEIIAGNDPPKVAIELVEANHTFYFPGDQFQYLVHVSDLEDDDLDPSRMNMWADYLPEGFDLQSFTDTLKNSPINISASSLVGRQLINQNNCAQCHYLDQRAVGPSFIEVAKRYRERDDVYDHLSQKIIQGTIGTWGQVEMPANPSISMDEAHAIVAFILSSNEQNEGEGSLPMEGKIGIAEEAKGGHYVLKASYRDGGMKEIPPMETVEIISLRDPRVFVSDFDTAANMRIYTPHFKQPNNLIPGDTMSFFGLNDVDLSHISHLGLDIINFEKIEKANWEVGVRVDAFNGETIGAVMMNDLEEGGEGFKKLPIKPTSGLRDIYVVFTNKNYQKGREEFEIRSIRFIK